MRHRLLLMVAVALVATLAFTAVTVAKPPTGTAGDRVTVPVTGTFTDALGGVGTFTG